MNFHCSHIQQTRQVLIEHAAPNDLVSIIKLRGGFRVLSGISHNIDTQERLIFQGYASFYTADILEPSPPTVMVLISGGCFQDLVINSGAPLQYLVVDYDDADDDRQPYQPQVSEPTRVSSLSEFEASKLKDYPVEHATQSRLVEHIKSLGL